MDNIVFLLKGAVFDPKFALMELGAAQWGTAGALEDDGPSHMN